MLRAVTTTDSALNALWHEYIDDLLEHDPSLEAGRGVSGRFAVPDGFARTDFELNLIEANNDTVGFVIVRHGTVRGDNLPLPTLEVAEMFIRKLHRGKDYAQKAILATIERHTPQSVTLFVLRSNSAGHRLARRVVRTLTGAEPTANAVEESEGQPAGTYYVIDLTIRPGRSLGVEARGESHL